MKGTNMQKWHRKNGQLLFSANLVCVRYFSHFIFLYSFGCIYYTPGRRPGRIRENLPKQDRRPFSFLVQWHDEAAEHRQVVRRETIRLSKSNQKKFTWLDPYAVQVEQLGRSVPAQYEPWLLESAPWPVSYDFPAFWRWLREGSGYSGKHRREQTTQTQEDKFVFIATNGPKRCCDFLRVFDWRLLARCTEGFFWNDGEIFARMRLWSF